MINLNSEPPDDVRRGAFSRHRLLIGEAPPTSSDPDKYHAPFNSRSRSGARLRTIMEVDDLHDYFFCTNLVPSWSGVTPGVWNTAVTTAAEDKAVNIRKLSTPWILVLCGRRVQSAFDVITDDEVGWTALDHHSVLMLPHPSGLNHFWNDPQNVTMVRDALRVIKSLGILRTTSSGRS